MLIQKIILLVAFVAGSFGLYAQISPVRELDKSMSFGTRPAFRVEFQGASDELVTDLWKTFAKERFSAKLKKDKRTSELYADKIRGSFSPNEYTIRSTVEELDGNNSALNVWFDLGSGFLNRRDYPQSANEVVSALSDFYVDVRREVIGREQKAAEAKQKELESTKRKLEKDNEGLHKDIEAYKAKIKKAEDDIVKNEQQQNSNVADQESQRRLIEEIKLRLQNAGSERY